MQIPSVLSAQHVTAWVGVCILWCLAGLLTTQDLAAQQESPFSQDELDYFENHVRPLLVDHCLTCHGADKDQIRGGLWLTSREQMLEGGDSGPAIVPGDPDSSLLMHSVLYEDYEMPPDGMLDEAQIKALRQWIEMGAPDPRTRDDQQANLNQPIDIQAGKSWWAFQKVPEQVSVPAFRDDHWSRTNIDRFVAAGYREAGITPVVDADRESLLRRTYLALTGLPPTPEQIQAFVKDPGNPEAVLAKVIDELLDSSAFGERWGRHWLDVARFAESSGGGRSLMFPNAWRFRDYVIESFNQDKPFDQFLKEQIAGDLLSADSHTQKTEQLVATGFLALGPTNYEQQDKELLRMEVIDEQVDTVGRAFLGLTLGCARCHDHKFDPVPMTDYYALAGIFGGTVSLVDGNVSRFVEQPIATESELDVERKYRDEVTRLTKQLQNAQKKLEQLGGNSQTDTVIKTIAVSKLAGLVVDDRQARLTGEWQASDHTASFIEGRYLHDMDSGKGTKTAVFEPKLETGGYYELRLAYSAGGNRASNVPVTIDHQDGKTTILVNQSQAPAVDGVFQSLGIYRFEANNRSTIMVSTENTDGHVVVDAVQLIKVAGAATDTELVSSFLEPLPQSKDAGERRNKQESRALRNARQQVNALDQQLKQLKKDAPRPLAVAMSVHDHAEPRDGHLYIRGSVRRPAQRVQRGFISVCCEGSPKPQLAKNESGRLQLAEWLAHPEHPLTARVYVNRIWRHLFGAGIVPTPDNFGTMGQSPSHPELLDYLARDFMDRGWSTKSLIRQIMLSRVYQLSTNEDAACRSVDVANRLLWRAQRRRVDAEVLRDSILFVSGSLDLQPGGLTIRKLEEYDLGYEFDTVRRSVYVPAFRNSMLDLFEVFDFANPNLVTGHRNTSTLPTQALFLMNSPMVIREADKAANRLLKHDELSQRQRVERAWLQVLGRMPDSRERDMAQSYLASFPADEDPAAAWASLYHTLFASVDFRYVN